MDENGWIDSNATKQLPEHGQRVLAWHQGCEHHCTYSSATGRFHTVSGRLEIQAQFWMPIPPPAHVERTDTF